MAESLISLKLPPGLKNNGTVLQSKDRWFVANLVRFYQGNIQPVGGWSSRTLTGDAIVGTPNAMFSWRTSRGTDYLAIGTTSGLYVITGSDSPAPVLDITPTDIQGDGLTHTWQLDLFGTYLVAADSQETFFDSSGGGGSGGGGTPSSVNTYAWAGESDVLSYAAPFIGDVPLCVFGVVVTPERFLVFLRGTDPGQTNPDFSTRRVAWPSQETLDDWVPADDNTAGSFPLSTDGTLMCGKATRGQTLLWTTTDVWTMTYVGGTLIYAFERVGTNCGILSPRAAVVLDTGACWMGSGRFYRFDGFVKPLECEVSDFVFGDFNFDAADTVFAYANPQFGEITWFYPSSDAELPDRYVSYSYQENHWTFGGLERTAGIERQAGSTSPVPVLINEAGTVYDHETGDDRGEDAVYLESGPLQVGEGDNVVRVQTLIPDDKTLGDVQAQFYTSFYPDETEVLHGPYTLRNKTSIRFTARQIRVRLEEVIATAWRIGVVRLGVIVSGRR